MQIIAYLNFDGQCEVAFRFYERVLGGKIDGMMTIGGTPAQEHVPAEFHGRIMHARLTVGDAVLMGSDAMVGNYHRPQGMSVALQVSEISEAERVFAALADGGTVLMPIAPTFWAARFGMVTDQFGIPWMVNCEGKS